MLPPGPPLLLLLLFLAGLPMGLWGCLQCDAKFKENLAKLRTELIQRQIHDTRLKARAESLLKGLAGDFFLHYATSQFSGYAGTALLYLAMGQSYSQGLSGQLSELQLLLGHCRNSSNLHIS